MFCSCGIILHPFPRFVNGMGFIFAEFGAKIQFTVYNADKRKYSQYRPSGCPGEVSNVRKPVPQHIRQTARHIGPRFCGFFIKFQLPHKAFSTQEARPVFIPGGFCFITVLDIYLGIYANPVSVCRRARCAAGRSESG
jgi:hypothetical protein